MAQVAPAHVVDPPVPELLGLAVIPVLDRAVIAGDTAVNLRGLSAVGAGLLLPRQIAVVPADGIGGAHGIIGQLVVFRDLPHQVGRGLPVRELLPQEGVEDGAGGVESLELVLDIQGGEYILRVAHRQVGGVGVIGGAVFVGGDDIGVELLVVLGEAVGGALRRGGLEVVEVAVLLLIVAQALAHVVQNLLGKPLNPRVRQVGPEPLRVESNLVHADQADGGEVVVKAAEIALRVGVEAQLQQLCDDGTLGLQAAGSHVHQLVQADVEVRLVLREIGDAGQIDGDDADAAGALAGTEESAGFLAQLPQVQAQAAAHAAHVARLHVGVDIIAEIGGAVLGGHLEQQLVVLGLAPVEVAGDGIGRDRVLEAAPVGVALDHQLDEGLVDHVHFLLALAVGKGLLFSADDGREVRQILRANPVQRDVAEGGLRAPAGGRVDAVDEGLDALLDFLLRQVVDLDKGGQIGVEAGERLSAGPLVLHDAEEVDHLVAEGAQVARRRGGNLPRNAAQPLLDQLLQTPARAVAGQHAQIVKVDRRAAVGLRHLGVVDLAEPVVGRDGAGVRQDQTAHGVGDGTVLLHAPVVDAQIVVHQVLVVEQGAADIAHLLPLLAVEDVGLRHIGIARLAEHALHAVLHVLDGDQAVPDLRLKVRRDPQGQHIDDAGMVFFVQRHEGFFNGAADFSDLKFRDVPVALQYLVHGVLLYLGLGCFFVRKIMYHRKKRMSISGDAF